MPCAAASGGRGKFRGGDGIVREIEMLSGVQVAVLSDRRKIPPYGLSGGARGQQGKLKRLRECESAAFPQNAASTRPAGNDRPTRNARRRRLGTFRKRNRGEAEKQKASKQSRLEAFHETNLETKTPRLRIFPVAKHLEFALSRVILIRASSIVSAECSCGGEFADEEELGSLEHFLSRRRAALSGSAKPDSSVPQLLPINDRSASSEFSLNRCFQS